MLGVILDNSIPVCMVPLALYLFQSDYHAMMVYQRYIFYYQWQGFKYCFMFVTVNWCQFLIVITVYDLSHLLVNKISCLI